MGARDIVRLTALLWLTGCAATGPTTPAESRDQTPTVDRAQAGALAEAAPLETGDALAPQAMPERPPNPAEAEQGNGLTAPLMLEALGQMASLSPQAEKQRTAQLQAKLATLTAGEQFELALLLSRKGADTKALKRAQLSLKRLADDAKEPKVSALLQLLLRNLELEQRYHMERGKTAELKKKIEHLKGLEQELEDSNKRIETFATPKAEQTQ